MEMIGSKARVVAIVWVAGLTMIGCVKTPPIVVEVVPDREDEMISEIADLTVKLQEKRGPLQGGEIFRGVHPKSLGCVVASFTVLKHIGGDYRVGLFARPETYEAMIRYSNAAVLKLPDLKDGENGSRGMAIKVFGVNGPVMLMDGGARNQDFLMINTAAFAFANVRDYLRLSRALMADRHGASPNLFFLPLALAALGRPAEYESAEVTQRRQFLNGVIKNSPVFEGFTPEDEANTFLSSQVVGKIKSKAVENPLEVQYFSAAPFRYGFDRVMKFSVVPAAGEEPRKAFSPEEAFSRDPDYLSRALKKSLAQGKTIHLSFMIQVVEESQLAGRKQDMIENAALAWDEEEFPFVKVAHITIDPDGQNEPLVDACDALQFTPWHALAAHEPLGGINRLRKPVYCASAEFRSNGGDPDRVLCQDAENY